ncbi:hypothetical protein BPNPMPFG_001247 [Mesorhizobium sp. AR07]|uniref:hypothetical protein n=1 Tax=Mesorhizobium sp. AR07 TaxID=2865838 RepID=UPI00215F8114|nr:hypothetical protein [Mesorhizobium sp. AR07]UVK48010.1 hypothetical protein BPNPMPFG_001247 [Mesorhizobium sp. AR07]
MSDEPARLAEGMTAVPRQRARIEDHFCEQPGCGKDAGWGFAKLKQEPHWFCFEHREDGERFR